VTFEVFYASRPLTRMLDQPPAKNLQQTDFIGALCFVFVLGFRLPVLIGTKDHVKREGEKECVCVCERERESVCVGVCVCVCVCVCE
jgi:hypothetical protein